mmetsp:Transcript_585/g.1789  ORF Transcript_585/g.1789 Transcript_585/m.1789 type:complete len:389 (-) Transcript_585:164-1330(-)
MASLGTAFLRKVAPGLRRSVLSPVSRLPLPFAHAPNAFAGAARWGSIFRPPELNQNLDLSHLVTQSTWTKEELDRIKETHHQAKDFVERVAYFTVQACRLGFDIGSLYKVKVRTATMTEQDWLRRIIFLETVAGVPGMVAGMLRHMTSLRLMRRDHGWIHSLLAEAENERMHLLIALTLRQPGPFFRMAVIGGQAIFLTWYSIAYMVCPRYCHRFVGYLEEEAVHTYTRLLEEIDAGRLPMFENMKAPKMARVYYNLPRDAMLRDVFECIRADESAHRDTNHQFGSMKADDPNTMVEHLRKGHFSHQNAYSGIVVTVHKLQEQAMLDEFHKLDKNGDGYISREGLKRMLEARGDKVSLAELDELIEAVSTDGDGRISYKEFAKLIHHH